VPSKKILSGLKPGLDSLTCTGTFHGGKVTGTTWVAKEVNSSGVINFENGTLVTGGLVSSLSDLRGMGTIHARGLVSDIDLVFDSQSSLAQSFRLDDAERDITINLEAGGTASIGVGYDDTASLQISGGVNVESVSGYLGYQTGSVGTATVTGEGSEWNNSSSLYVAKDGSGTLGIDLGGVVSNSTGYIANGSDSVGTATVTGAGSEWNNSSSLYVAKDGSGTLGIGSGGVVSNSTGYIANGSDSVSTATVTGEGLPRVSNWIGGYSNCHR